MRRAVSSQNLGKLFGVPNTDGRHVRLDGRWQQRWQQRRPLVGSRQATVARENHKP